ncbi:MAG TPA: SPFH domain-containing protein [Steroidobacteraceae bacterium]|nr:SPFH domain-containing protein [Steroidobacteraceae bacterium]
MSATLIEPTRTAASVPVGPPPPPPPGPIAQSVAIGFRVVYVAGLLLLAIWLMSNIRTIPSDSQAVVLRFGRIVRAQEAGLLVAWPRPIERVEVLPGPERQLSQDVAPLPPPTEKARELVGPFGTEQPIPQDIAAYMTGDHNILLLHAALIYRITDPIAYVLQHDHVAPALDRLFRAATVDLTAGRNLNDFLVVQSAASTTGSTQNVRALRVEVLRSLLDSVNARLHTLAASGSSLGIEVARIDMTAYLPPEAKTAFDAVLLATQAADRQVAEARTDAERRRQEANRERDQLLAAAQASAAERVSRANVETARILALARQETPQTRNSLLLREYRAQVSRILNRAGSTVLVDPKTGVQFLLPGKPK